MAAESTEKKVVIQRLGEEILRLQLEKEQCQQQLEIAKREAIEHAEQMKNQILVRSRQKHSLSLPCHAPVCV